MASKYSKEFEIRIQRIAEKVRQLEKEYTKKEGGDEQKEKHNKQTKR